MNVFPRRASACGWARAVGLVFFTSLGLGATEKKEWTRPPPEFRQVAALESVRQAAGVTHLSLENMSAQVERAVLQPGDRVTSLLTLTEGKKFKQWVIELEGVAPNEKEKEKTGATQTRRFFSSNGYEFSFGSGRAILQMKIIGPLDAADLGRKAATAPEVNRRRIAVGADYLALGLERVPAVVLRMRAAKEANPNPAGAAFHLSSSPFPAESAAANRKIAEASGLTEADERAVAGSALALMEFFVVTMQTPGLQDVAKSVLDIPWWSIVSSGGKMPNINFDGLNFFRKLEPEKWNLPAGMGIYAYPFLLRLNGEPAMLCQLAVTSPQAPLLVSAGVVGFAAGRPDGKGPVLTLQVVSSQLAASPVAPEPTKAP